ncbi:MAG: hypothetical protein IKZ98_00690 [Clostridia bacterium]|nr:hypothetical protein [Clostridia bacterium]
MKELYTDKDLTSLSSQLKKRYFLLGIVLAVILGFFIYSLTIRVEWLSVVLLALFCAISVFVIELFCLPLHRYKKLVQTALSGRTHTETLVYDHEESEPSLVDGVLCTGLIFLGEPDKHGTREQRYYWDKQIPLPAFTPGSQVTLKYTGKNIIGYEL